MGIDALMGQLPASGQCQVIHPVDFDSLERHKLQCLSLYVPKERLDSSVMASFVLFMILMRGLNIYDSVVLLMTLQQS